MKEPELPLLVLLLVLLLISQTNVATAQAHGTWAQTEKLVTGRLLSVYDDSLVALDGDQVLVGVSHGIGVVYVLEWQPNGTWAQTANLTADDAGERDRFGVSVALDGDRAVVGASGYPRGSTVVGVAYVLERQPNGTWAQAAKLMANDAEEGDWVLY